MEGRLLPIGQLLLQVLGRQGNKNNNYTIIPVNNDKER